jgi:NAD(P)-dependent dehydrogenase (short-subunit alcohol dehydrogenase family)
MTIGDRSDWLGLGGRVCVVTGAGSGIGSAIAEGFARAGAKVALLDRDRAANERAAAVLHAKAGHVLPLECDVSDPGSVVAAAAEILRSIGPCDVLVNNAGFLKPGPLASLPLSEWNTMLAVNLTGYFICAQVFGRQMFDRRSGSIVHVASIAARQPQGFSGAYSVGKAGIVMLSRQLALEWGPHGVRSNVVSPGLIRTPLSEKFYEQQDIAERRAAIVPTRRIGVPRDIADVVLFLACDRASYVNGDEITVDGGFSLALMGQIPRPGYEDGQ